MVEEFLRDLPSLAGDEPIIRDYGLTGHGGGEGGPVPRLLTRDSIRYKAEEELATERREAGRRRAERFAQIYDMLDLSVVGYKDGTLEVRWGLNCRRLLASTRTSP